MSTTVLMNQEQSKQVGTPRIDLSQIFKSISDDKSLTLFNSIAHRSNAREKRTSYFEARHDTKAILRKNGTVITTRIDTEERRAISSYYHGQNHLPSSKYYRQGSRDQPMETADDRYTRWCEYATERTSQFG